MRHLPGKWPKPEATILIVVGTRPEVIKLSPVARALGRNPRFEVSVCVVAQQGDILDQAVAEWNLKPDYRIDMPTTNRSLANTLAAMLPGLADCIERVRPDMVIVQGDTTTNLGAALAAFYAHVPVAHVEAGLRSGDLQQPFPEEMHRILVDRIAAVHYAPTEGARQNLLAENYLNDGDVVVSGNTVVDALLSASREVVENPVSFPDDRRVLLVTAHRRESFGAGIESICGAIRVLSAKRADLDVVFVLHSNPAARAPVESALAGLCNVRLIEPQPYRTFIKLLSRADIVLTDSGGIQEEAPYLGTPVLVTRQVTERPEASEAGAAWIIGTDPDVIVSSVTALLDDPVLYARMARYSMPYGDGWAASRIHDDLERRLMGSSVRRSAPAVEAADDKMDERIDSAPPLPALGTASPAFEGVLS